MKQKVGFIGLGHMGLPMAENVLKAGFPLWVYNRTKEKAAPLLEKGASGQQLLRNSPDYVMFWLPWCK